MRHLLRAVIAGLLLPPLLSFANVWGADSTPALYKEALIHETTVRDLEKAAQLFEEYLQRPDAEPPLKASALLHAGDCYEKLGKTDLAKKSWTRLTQEHPQETGLVQEAKNRLLSLEAREQQVNVSTPVVQIVYKSPPTRFAFEWLDLAFYEALDSKKSLNENYGYTYITFPHSLVYFAKPQLAFGMEGRILFNTDNYESAYQYTPGPSSYSQLYLSRALSYIAPIAQVEKRLPWGLTPYAKLGPAAYRFHFEGHGGESTKWSPGLTSEFGLTLGGSRGFTLSLGYSILGFVQKAPSSDVIGGPMTGGGSAFTEEMTQAHGWRWLGGTTVKLGFRW